MVTMLQLINHVTNSFDVSKMAILALRTSRAVDSQKNSKTKNWRNYSMRIRLKREKSLQIYWEWLNKQFLYDWNPWEWFKSKAIGFCTSSSRETPILQHVEGRSNVAKSVKTYLGTLKWGSYPHVVLSRRYSFRLPFDSIDGTAWLISIFALMKKSKNGSIRESLQKIKNFFDMKFENCLRDGKKT